MRQMAEDLLAAGYGEASFALVDVANPLPLISSLKRLDYVSPWYYGGTRDARGADYLVVPKCPISRPTYKVYLDAMNGSDMNWQLVDTLRHVWVFSQRPEL